MADGFETEIKLGLPDESAWRWVRERIAPVRVVRQTNHYFDTADRALSAARIGVRLRVADGRLRLTVKGAAEGAEDAVLTRRAELERDRPLDDLPTSLNHGLVLDEDLAHWRRSMADTTALNRFLDRLTGAISADPLRTIGAFDNERSIGSLRLVDATGEITIAVELDRTRFPGGRVDFELEVETSSEDGGRLERTRAALEDWLERDGGIQAFARESKLARFEATLEAGESGAR